VEGHAREAHAGRTRGQGIHRHAGHALRHAARDLAVEPAIALHRATLRLAHGHQSQTGATLWDVPFGTDEGLDKIGLPKLPAGSGMANLGGPISTSAGLVFIGATLDAYLRAFDVETGRELWKYRLPAAARPRP
jgi:glucose dehydrogenase